MSIKYLFVKYRTQNKNLEFGQIKGEVIEISPSKIGEDQRGSKEGDWLGFTKMPVDKSLWDQLMTGQVTIDDDNTTTEEIAISSNPDLYRVEAAKYVSLSTSDWKESPYYQKPANERIYSDYVKVFLNEFTKITRHIPTEQLIHLYPNSWIFPTTATIHVGRDGVAIVFNYPNRPETTCVKIDIDKILDELLLPHPNNRTYASCGPNRVSKCICNDSHYVRFIGDGSFVQRADLGNPDFIIFEKKYHGFWENFGLLRGFGYGETVSREFQFVEFFGNITESNFTEERAKCRARIYAEQWATEKLSNGELNAVPKIRRLIDELETLISSKNPDELKIELFLDKHPWMLERGFGYKRYYSQVSIDNELLSRTDKGIKPDKFLERNDGYCDILDLKRPDTPILVKKSNRTHATAKLTEAEAQIDTYVEYCKEPDVRDNLREKGINVLAPVGIVLIGRRPEDDDMERWEYVKKRLRVNAYTYDDLIDELNTIVAWIEKIVSQSK